MYIVALIAWTLLAGSHCLLRPAPRRTSLPKEKHTRSHAPFSRPPAAQTIEKALDDANEWLDENQDGEKDDFAEKLKEVQAVCSPIISKIYQESGGAPGGGFDSGDSDDLDGHDEL